MVGIVDKVINGVERLFAKPEDPSGPAPFLCRVNVDPRYLARLAKIA
jgi:hypothetical protein